MIVHQKTLRLSLFFCYLLFSYIFQGRCIGAENTTTKELKLAEAIRITLAHQPEIHLSEKNVTIQEGILQSEKGTFDMMLGLSSGFTTYGYTHAPGYLGEGTDGNTAYYEVNIGKQYRSGVEIKPNLRILRSDISGYPYDPKKNVEVNFLMTVPLLKGRGREINAAGEMVAEKNVEISKFEMHHKISEIVYNAVSNYWNYLALNEKLVQLKESEERAKKLVEETRLMIQAGKISPSELQPLMANLADKTAYRIAGSQYFLEAKQSIGIVMGLPANEIIGLPEPGDQFPIPRSHHIDKLVDRFEKLLKLAYERRADYLALKTRENIGKIQVKAAENNLRRKVDFNINLGYSGVSAEDEMIQYVSPYGVDESEKTVTLSLDYEWPVGNNKARGVLVQQKSIYDGYVIETNDLERKISSNIFLAITALQKSALELINAQNAVASYRKAVENEQNKFKLGVGTLMDIISMEDRLTDSLLNKISAQLKFANALVLLQFETGGILKFERNSDTVTMDGVISLSGILE